MTDEYGFPGYKLPVNPAWEGGALAHGFVTPQQDKIPQILSVLPRRALPIIFLPGTMGSNLRMSSARQKAMGRKNNIAWRPDHLLATAAMRDDSAAERQLRLDPAETEVDLYDPIGNPTGDPDETSGERNDKVSIGGALYMLGDPGGNWPLLTDDRPAKGRVGKTAVQKALERGWGEVYFGSYSKLLLRCGARLNVPCRAGKIDSRWTDVVGVNPSTWSAHADPVLKPLDEATFFSAVKGVWFPVHAMGYNWLAENKESAILIARRITALIDSYVTQGFQCEKVILVTHSMGGLVARAVIHPKMGNLNGKVLGIVHGVMPAIGAGAAYKRMRCGVEGDDIAARVIGNKGTLMTAVLANSQGGLELLPSQAYGNDWLQVKHRGKTIRSYPNNGDPYEEIYKAKGKWYGLVNSSALNPAGVKEGPSFDKTCALLTKAKKFHALIADTYHEQSYAHFGADPGQATWHHVVWAIDDRAALGNVDRLKLVGDNDRGALTLADTSQNMRDGEPAAKYNCSMCPATDPGDQTVPMFSADHQLRSGKFKGIFRQSGYEHQNSYKNKAALDCTLYSLIRIASTMVWAK